MNLLRKNWLITLQILLSLFLLYRVFGNTKLQNEILAILSQANPWWAVGGLATAFVCELLCAWRWSFMLKAFDVPVSFGRVVVFSFAGLFYSLFLPGAGGGDVFRIIYVMRLYPGQKRRAVMSVIADRLCGLLALAIFLAIAFMFRHVFPPESHARTVLNISLTLLTIPVVLVFLWWTTTFPFMKRKGARFIPSRVRDPILILGDNFWKIIHHPKKILAGVVVSTVALAAHFSTYFFSAMALGVHVTLQGIFLVMPVVDAFVLLPVTFFGIGLRETIFQNLLGNMYSIEPGAAALVAFTGFALQAIIGLMGGLFVPFTVPKNTYAEINPRSEDPI